MEPFKHFDNDLTTTDRHIIGFIQGLIMFPSIAGNVCLAYSLIRDPKLRKLHLFRLNLTLRELLGTLATYWMPLHSAITGHWYFGTAGAIYCAFLNGWMAFASIMSFVAISIERCLVIWRPFCKQHFTLGRKMIIVVVTWCLSLMLTIPPIFGWGQYVLDKNEIFPIFNYTVPSSTNRAFILYLFTGGYGIPLLIICICYAKIVLIVRESGKSLLLRTKSPNRNIIKVPTTDHKKIIPTPLSLLTTYLPEEATEYKQLHRSLSFPPKKPKPVVAQISKLQQFWNFSRKLEVKLAKSALVLIGVFLVSWTPFAVLVTFGMFSSSNPASSTTTTFCLILAKASVILNPLCYTLLDIKILRKKTEIKYRGPRRMPSIEQLKTLQTRC